MSERHDNRFEPRLPFRDDIQHGNGKHRRHFELDRNPPELTLELPPPPTALGAYLLDKEVFSEVLIIFLPDFGLFGPVVRLP